MGDEMPRQSTPLSFTTGFWITAADASETIALSGNFGCECPVQRKGAAYRLAPKVNCYFRSDCSMSGQKKPWYQQGFFVPQSFRLNDALLLQNHGGVLACPEVIPTNRCMFPFGSMNTSTIERAKLIV